MYRVVQETERTPRRAQVVKRIGENMHGVKTFIESDGESYNLGIDWVGSIDDARKKVNQFVRG